MRVRAWLGVCLLALLGLGLAWLYVRDPAPPAAPAHALTSELDDAPTATAATTASAEATPDPAPIEGRVVDAQGAPVAGAWVHAGLDPDNAVRADARGRYVLVTEACKFVCELRARADGYLPALGMWSAGRPGPELVLLPAVSLTVTVDDAGGGVVPGARVSVRARVESGPAPPGVTGETDEKGQVTLHAPGGAVEVTATADGYSEVRASARAPGMLRVTLEVAADVAGLVVDGEGRPVVGVSVQVGDRRSANTLEDGRFVVKRVRPGVYRPSVADEGWIGESAAPVTVDPSAPPMDVRITVRRAAYVHARILFEDGRSCPAPRLALRASASERTHDSTTGAHVLSMLEAGLDHRGVEHLPEAERRALEQRLAAPGSVLVANLPPGQYSARSGCEADGPQKAQDDLRIEDRPVLDLELSHPSTHPLTGVVMDARGQAVARAWVRAVGAGEGLVRADTSGGFVMRLPEGTYQVEASDSDGHVESAPVEVEVPRSSSLVLELPVQVDLQVRVVDEAGGAVASARVFAHGAAGGLSGRTDADGRLTLAVAPGPTKVYARRTMQSEPVVKEVTVQPPGPVEAVVVLPRAQPLSGVVVGPDGAPVPDARVRYGKLWPPPSHERLRVGEGRGPGRDETVTDLEGRFSFPEVDGGPYWVAAQASAGAGVAPKVRPGTPARITLASTGTLRVEVRDADGAPVTGALVTAGPVEGGVVASGRTQDGQVVLHGLPESPTDLYAELGDAGAWRQMTPRAGAQVSLRLSPAVPLSGTVRRAGAPVQGVQVYVFTPAVLTLPLEDEEILTDAAGRFFVPRVPPGPLLVRPAGQDAAGQPCYADAIEVAPVGRAGIRLACDR